MEKVLNVTASETLSGAGVMCYLVSDSERGINSSLLWAVAIMSLLIDKPLLSLDHIIQRRPARYYSPAQGVMCGLRQVGPRLMNTNNVGGGGGG